MALPGKYEKNRGDEDMNRTKNRVLLARINPIQAFSLLLPKKTRVFHGILSDFRYKWVKLTSL